MYAEYSGLVVLENGYMDSVTFIYLLNQITEYLDSEIAIEHHLYTIGKKFLALQLNDKQHLDIIQKIYGVDWKTSRFHNLVRLGADIDNACLGSLPRPTLVGAFLYLKEKLRQSESTV